MCGIAAVINGTKNEAVKMGIAIHHRGTQANVKNVDNLTVYFTHLPIETDEYNQPVEYRGYTVWLNGYVSNWRELSKEHSLIAENDTELLAWWLVHNKPLSRLNGFFAVLYHDGKETKYFTDRYGIKQLYVYKNHKTTYICSEVKGLKAIIDLKVDFDALQDWEYSLGVMNSNTIYRGVERAEKLPFTKPEKVEISYEDAKERLTELWVVSVARNTYDNDGCYLSGGVDSGMIAKWFNPKYTFSVDYLNELSEIENIKRNSKGIHYTVICNEELKDTYSEQTLMALDDFKAGSCYTNFAVAELASKFCKVMYSGAGGDEIFNGYTHRYDKSISDVIRRTDVIGKHYDITHKEYDWRFLDAVLIVEDRICGYHTMETRYPLLDNDFVDFALSLPNEYLDNKRILKDISGLSNEVVNGEKKGFSNPHYTNKEWVEFCKSKL